MDSPASLPEVELNTRALMSSVTSKLVKVAIATSVGCTCMAVAFMLLLPLKQSVPYIVHVNDQTGEVTVPAGQSVTAFKPQWDNTAFFLRRWITDMFTINQYLTASVEDPRAQYFLRGANAISEYKAFRVSDDTFARLVADPSLVRDVKITSLTPVAGTKNGAVAQITMTTLSKGTTTTVNSLLTVYYVFLPSTDPAVLQKNPIGVYITDFKLSGGGAQ